MKRFAALLLALMLMVALLPACSESSVPAGARERVYNLLDGILAGETARAGAENTGACGITCILRFKRPDFLQFADSDGCGRAGTCNILGSSFDRLVLESSHRHLHIGLA